MSDRLAGVLAHLKINYNEQMCAHQGRVNVPVTGEGMRGLHAKKMKVSVYSLCHFEVDPFTCLTSYFRSTDGIMAQKAEVFSYWKSGTVVVGGRLQFSGGAHQVGL